MRPKVLISPCTHKAEVCIHISATSQALECSLLTVSVYAAGRLLFPAFHDYVQVLMKEHLCGAYSGWSCRRTWLGLCVTALESWGVFIRSGVVMGAHLSRFSEQRRAQQPYDCLDRLQLFAVELPSTATLTVRKFVCTLCVGCMFLSVQAVPDNALAAVGSWWLHHSRLGPCPIASPQGMILAYFQRFGRTAFRSMEPNQERS